MNIPCNIYHINYFSSEYNGVDNKRKMVDLFIEAVIELSQISYETRRDVTSSLQDNYDKLEDIVNDSTIGSCRLYRILNEIFIETMNIFTLGDNTINEYIVSDMINELVWTVKGGDVYE